MAEGREGNLLANIAKADTVQREKVKSAETPLALEDQLLGRNVGGFVKSWFDRENGGGVDMGLSCGEAHLNQFWRFDQNGNLSSLAIKRTLGPRNREASILELYDDGNGKLRVERSSKTELFPQWQEEFHTAKTRIAAGQQRHTTPQLPQK